MMTRSAIPLLTLLTCLASNSTWAQGPQQKEPSAMGKQVTTAMAGNIRSMEEAARDANRKPVETLDFFGIEPDMKVLELFPGGGWYTKLLGPALADNGKLYTAFTGSRIKPLIANTPELSKVEHKDFEAKFEETPVYGIYKIDGYSLPVKKLDAVLSFRNVHNLTPESRAHLNTQVFKALKPGGIYGLVDHTRRHNAPITQELFRRADPVIIIKEALDAGFELDAISDLHYRPDDSLQFDTTRASVTGNSDRFTLRFRKPK